MSEPTHHTGYRQLSFWHESLPEDLEARPALQGSHDADVAIVGAGYTGLWAAYYLKRLEPSLDIRLVEAETAGYGASGRNGGWCAAYLSGIDHWLGQVDSRAAALRLQRLMFETVRDVGEASAREGIECHYDRSGGLEIATNEEQLRRLRLEREHLRALGFGEDDYRWLEGGDLSAIPRIRGARAAIHMPHAAAVHPARLARGLAAAVERLGVRIYEHSPANRAGNGEVITRGGRILAKHVILATEGYGGTLPGRARRLIPVHSMMVATEPLNAEQIAEAGLQTRFCFGSCDHVVTYGQRTADDRIAFGCRGTYYFGSHIRRRFDPVHTDFEAVRETLRRFFPTLGDLRFTHAWGGCLGVSRSLRPSVNYDRESGFGWAGGYFGNGVAASHLAGQTLADLVLDRDTERVRTPWVNPAEAKRRWEPEPLRWLELSSARGFMHLVDHAEHRDSRLAPLLGRVAERLLA
ncbi:MAG: FAD-binding oxidoreductase [Lysobacterales bacterium]|jgi:glycine/D-amino acid oxidase-like deaminating enzyme